MIDDRAYMEGIYRNDYGMSGVPRPPRRRPRHDGPYSYAAEADSLKNGRFRIKRDRLSTRSRGRRLAWHLIRIAGPAVAGASVFMFVLAGG